jgi:phosphatidylserine decarboxylase
MIHKEGYKILISLFVLLLLLVIAFAVWVPVAYPFVLVAAIVFFLIVLQFFRNPKRPILAIDNQQVYAPADGKVVVIEETKENEFFKDKRIQISIFMSPINVHVNRNPIGGEVIYSEYHPGKYLVAWHPKSSTENERTTVVIDSGKHQVLFRQIAGAMAKRIKNYLQVGQQVKQGDDMGFISFGSRVDVFLPLDAKINVHIGDKVKGNQTVLAMLG